MTAGPAPDAAPSPGPTPGVGAGAATVLDCRGQRCPLPVINLARRITDVPVDSILHVLCDDPVAAVDIPAWCHLRHQLYLGLVAGMTPAENLGYIGYAIRRLT